MTTFSREELFDKIWSQPITKVAAELGLSDTAVRRMCGRHDIPVPSRGYWAQVAAGRSFPRPKLRPLKLAGLDVITFVGATPLAPEVKAAVDRVKAARPPKAPRAKMVEQGPAPDGTPQNGAPRAAAAPLEIHPLALRTQTKLANAKGAGLAGVKGKGLFIVTASPAQSERIARILTQLITAVEGLGWRVEDRESGLGLVPDGEPIGFDITEQIDRVKHEPTEAEQAALRKHEEARERAARRGQWFSGSSSPQIPERDSVSNGRLTLSLAAGAYRSDGLRRRFSDGKTQRLEGMIGAIIETLAAYAASEKASRERRERERVAAQEAEKHRKEAERRFRLETKRLEFLELQIQRHRRAIEVEAFIADTEEPGAPEDVVADFLAWARGYAASLREDISPAALQTKLAALDLMNDERDIDSWRPVDHSLDPETPKADRYLQPTPRHGAPWWYGRR